MGCISINSFLFLLLCGKNAKLTTNFTTKYLQIDAVMM